MSKKDGGPAFPFMPNANPGEWAVGQSGMSLRDYFAAKAMHEILVGGGWSDYAILAKEAYEIADAMLEQREK